MDPNFPGTEDHGQAPSRRPPRDPLTADFAPSGPVPARTTRLVCGDFLLTVNPVDGSEIEPCPPHERPEAPAKRTPAARAEYERAALPPAPPGHRLATPELLERQEIRERLVRLLTRGRTVRLTGPGGSGRTALLDLVAEDCADLAPDGVVRLDGLHRTPDDLLRDLFHTVYDAPRHRLEPDELRETVKEVGAVVLIDDLEFGGTALTELLDAAPECAFLLAATPDTPAATGDVEEVDLPGLDRAAGVEILQRSVGRDLTEEEAVWAGDLWFESEGLPLRFVQAGALLRQREQLRASGGVVDEYGVFEDVRGPADAVLDLPLEDEEAEEVPLPSLAEAAAPAPLLASRLSTSARAALRFAVALDGELPHPAHLPALVGDTHADAALGELLGCGLVSPAGPRYRLAAGVRAQLEAAGYDEDAPAEARTAARHYAWWAAHPSVTPERVCAEAAAVLTALETVLPGTEPADEGEDEQATAVRLAHAAAAAFAAGLHWTAWEQALHAGSEAARLAQDVPERAYFHHELGILALVDGQLDRARSELEVSHGMRTALSDMRGTVAGRRALALVADRSGDLPGLAALMAAEEPAPARTAPLTPAPAAFTPSYGYGQETVVARQPGAAKERGGVRAIARRNLVAAGSGALLVAVLGTVVTLGMTSGEGAGGDPASTVGGNPTATQDLDDGTLGAVPKRDEPTPAGAVTTRPAGPGPDGTPGTSDDPSPSATTGSPTADPTGTQSAGGTSPEPTHGGGSSGPTGKPTKTGKPSTSPTGPTDEPTTEEPTDPGGPSTPDDPTTPPTTSTSASRPADSATASAPASTAATDATDATGTPVTASTEPPVI
ncbi:ATP-binding protein [Streptomyces seoulensis]|uniref:ATP-binding protein n=1 Tax=Streptomyces seoulensis TaxID=73044 RepID=A0A4P6U0A5_STRSO|nr:ATP-binding protein [Streptomyces seoulensis]QBJ92364.1 ATP-binding protein [Streptomyces seoulensis]